MQDKKHILQLAIASVIKEQRGNKSISRLSNEIELSKSIWSELEQGNKDIQISTFWRIAEAVEIKPHLLMKKVQDKLGDDFSFIDSL